MIKWVMKGSIHRLEEAVAMQVAILDSKVAGQARHSISTLVVVVVVVVAILVSIRLK
jgi:hypothetical protein